MAEIRISLSEPMQSFVDEQVAQGLYSSVDEYLQALIDQDQQRKKTHLETKLLEGLNSGEPTPMTMQDWSTIRQAVKANLQHHGED